MITSFSLPGLPSLLSLRIPLSCAAGLCAFASAGAAAEIPNAESTEANRIANILRVTLKFMDLLLFSLKLDSGQRKTKHVAPRRNRHILFSRNRITHRRRADILPSIEMPERFTGLRIYCLKRSSVVAKENQAPSGRHRPARRMAAPSLRILPRKRPRLQVVRHQYAMRSFVRNLLHSG